MNLAAAGCSFIYTKAINYQTLAIAFAGRRGALRNTALLLYETLVVTFELHRVPFQTQQYFSTKPFPLFSPFHWGVLSNTTLSTKSLRRRGPATYRAVLLYEILTVAGSSFKPQQYLSSKPVRRWAAVSTSIHNSTSTPNRCGGVRGAERNFTLAAIPYENPLPRRREAVSKHSISSLRNPCGSGKQFHIRYWYTAKLLHEKPLRRRAQFSQEHSSTLVSIRVYTVPGSNFSLTIGVRQPLATEEPPYLILQINILFNTYR